MSAETHATVVAIDPGGTTGWSIVSVEADALVDDETSVLASIVWNVGGQYTGDENAQADDILLLMESYPEAARVTEDFSLRMFTRGRELLAPVRIIARVEYGLSRSEAFVGGVDGDGLLSPLAGALLGRTDGGFPVVGFGREVPGVSRERMFYQASSLALSTITDVRLREWDLYVPGAQHARDALRHSLMFLRRAKGNRRLRGVAWPDLYG